MLYNQQTSPPPPPPPPSPPRPPPTATSVPDAKIKSTKQHALKRKHLQHHRTNTKADNNTILIPVSYKYLEERVQVAAPTRGAERLKVVLLESGVFPAAASQHLLRQLRLPLYSPYRVRWAPGHSERFARHLYNTGTEREGKEVGRYVFHFRAWPQRSPPARIHWAKRQYLVDGSTNVAGTSALGRRLDNRSCEGRGSFPRPAITLARYQPKLLALFANI